MDLGGQHVEHESVVFPYGQEGWQHTGFIKISVARSSRQVITPPALVRPYLQGCVQF